MEEEKKTESKYAGLSKGQIKKLKEKEKKEKEAASAQSAASSGGADVQASLESQGDDADASPAPKGKKAKKGKKGKGGLSEAMKKKIADEVAARQAEEERVKEIERQAQEEWDRKEAERLAEEQAQKASADAKKLAKLEEKKKMQAEGTWLSKAQLKKKKEADARRKQMIAQGLISGDAVAADNDDDQPKRVGAISNKKKDKKNKKQQEEAQAETPQGDEEEQETPAADTANDVETTKTKADDIAGAQAQTAQPAVQQEEEEEREFSDWEDAVDEVAESLAAKAKRENLPVAMAENEEFSSEEEKVEEGEEEKKTDQPSKKAKKKANKQDETETNNALDAAAQGGDRRARQLALLEARKKRSQAKTAKKLRCPIVCIMGHVDTGKTLILDKLRKTNVQANEAGGITQQIGATYFPPENLQNHIDVMASREEFDLEIPGFLVIDTPGHESFTNLRSRGSSLCDLAVLVVDIMHGLEQQTLESIQLLKQKNTPFCIALNKIDRLNQWNVQAHANSRDTIDAQNVNSQNHFEAQLAKTVLAFNEQGFNVALYWENQSPQDTLSFVPTSAITGEGLSDLIYQLCKMGQTSEREKLTEKDIFECTVLEVKVIEGHGTTIDVVLVNGVLKVGDTIVISGLNGPIQTNIRALLTPFPMKEMRVKGEYQHHNKIKGAMGIKISAPNLDYAIAGSELFKCSNQEEIQDAIDQIEGDLVDILEKYVDKTQDGVCVQASTIGSLEALLEFLYQMGIPVSSVNIGPVHKKDVLKAMKSLVSTSEGVLQEYACLLVFDVKVMPDAQNFAEENGIKVFTAKIIYHLFDAFTEYVEECKNNRKRDKGSVAVFPVICEMVPDACFNTKNPIVIGVNVIEGVLKTGTPLCVPDRDNLKIGVVQSIEANKKSVPFARANTGSVAVKITNDGSVQYGRHFDDQSNIVSLITRDSIDQLKQHFRDEMTDQDWRTCIKLKKLFEIQ